MGVTNQAARAHRGSTFPTGMNVYAWTAESTAHGRRRARRRDDRVGARRVSAPDSEPQPQLQFAVVPSPTTVVRGSGVYVPDGVVTNERLSRLMDTTDEWIRQRTGIAERRFARRGQSSAVLGVRGRPERPGRRGARADGHRPDRLRDDDPGPLLPGQRRPARARARAPATHALDIRMQCAGFLSGLQVSDAFIRSGSARRVLLVGAECHASFFPWSEADWAILFGESDGPASEEGRAWGTAHRDRAVLFGDGAGAFVLEAHESGDGRGFLGFRMRTDGNHWDKLYVPGGGSASFPYFTPEMFADNAHGSRSSRAARSSGSRRPRCPRSSARSSRSTGSPRSDLSLLLMHQANLRINEAVQKHLGPLRRAGLQQHPALRQHDGRHAAAGLPRGEGGGPHPAGRSRRLHGARRGPPLGRGTPAGLAGSPMTSSARSRTATRPRIDRFPPGCWSPGR